MRPALVLALLAVARMATAATAEPLLKDFRIALRMGPDRVLIIGGEIRSLDVAQVPAVNETFPADLASAADLPPLSPIEDLHVATPPQLRNFSFVPQTQWRPGDRWKLFTGATEPIAIVVEKIGFGFYCGGPGGYAFAIARHASPTTVHLLTGLRAEAWLASPSGSRHIISQ